MYYLENVPMEKEKGNIEKEKDWIKNGEIEFEDVCVRYRPNLPLVLKNLSFKIEAKQKIGIVGRLKKQN